MNRYTIPIESDVQISIYNIKGQFVEKLVEKEQNAGTYKIRWQALDTASGIYFIRFKSSGSARIRKCLLLKKDSLIII